MWGREIIIHVSFSANSCKINSKPIFWLGRLFLYYWVVWAVYRFWKLSPHWSHPLQMFSPRLYVFILSVVSFAVQKLICLIRSHLFIFVFIYIVLMDWSKYIGRIKFLVIWGKAEVGHLSEQHFSKAHHSKTYHY